MDGVRPILAMFLSAQGRHREADEQLTEKVKVAAAADHDVSYWLATAYLLQGRQVEAFRWLETAIDLGNENYPWFESDPNWTELTGRSEICGIDASDQERRVETRGPQGMKTFVIGDVHGRCAQMLDLLEMIPRDEVVRYAVFLGDLIDRGPDAPGCVDHVLKLCREQSGTVICLRGNHEQMLLDFIDGTGNIWITPVTGGERTFEQYAGEALVINSEHGYRRSPPYDREQDSGRTSGFFRERPSITKTNMRFYVHAGLDHGKHPRETSPQLLLWISDMDFYKNYRGKPCVFGHTPTPFLPLRGRVGGTAFTSSTVRSGSTRATTTVASELSFVA